MKKESHLHIGRKVIFFLLCAYAVVQLFPLLWLILFSLKDNTQIFGGNVLGFPSPWAVSYTHLKAPPITLFTMGNYMGCPPA